MSMKAITAKTKVPVTDPVTITEFRKNIFQIADLALQGQPVEFTHKGQVIRLIPDQKHSKLSRLTPMQVVNPRTGDLQEAKQDLLAEMEKSWTKDWDDQGL
jgi:hypothetical protein